MALFKYFHRKEAHNLQLLGPHSSVAKPGSKHKEANKEVLSVLESPPLGTINYASSDINPT